MRIGEVAGRAGVTPDTIRYYERIGLLEPPTRLQSGYRNYQPEVADDIRFIKKAQMVGLRLEDVREVLEISLGGRAPCEHVRGIVIERLADVEGRLRQLRALRKTLKAVLTRLDDRPPQTGSCRCSVIESAEAT